MWIEYTTRQNMLMTIKKSSIWIINMPNADSGIDSTFRYFYFSDLNLRAYFCAKINGPTHNIVFCYAQSFRFDNLWIIQSSYINRQQISFLSIYHNGAWKKFDFRFAWHCNTLGKIGHATLRKNMDTLINLFETIRYY